MTLTSFDLFLAPVSHAVMKNIIAGEQVLDDFSPLTADEEDILTVKIDSIVAILAVECIVEGNNYKDLSLKELSKGLIDKEGFITIAHKYMKMVRTYVDDLTGETETEEFTVKLQPFFPQRGQWYNPSIKRPVPAVSYYIIKASQWSSVAKQNTLSLQIAAQLPSLTIATYANS